MTEWLKNTVFYQVYPQSFFDSNGDGIGDINGLSQKLDYIKGLGCNGVWINPCFESPFMDAGYDVADYKKVASRYGTNEDLKNLFEKAHKMNMKIILDLVPGHTSDKNSWFEKSKQPFENEYSSRYIWTDSVWEAPPEYRLMCGITDRDGNYMVNYFSSQPALNYGFYNITHKWQMPFDHPECIKTREAIKDVMCYWLDMGCDGFRVDMADSLVKNDPEKTATSKVWQDISQHIKSRYPHAVLISEWCCPEKALSCGFDCDFYLDHRGNGYSTMLRYFDEKNENKSYFSKNGRGDITVLANELTESLKKTRGKGYISFLTCNHDIARLTRWYEEREIQIAYAAVFTLPGVPFLYYGDEIGLRYRDDLTSKEGGFYRTGSRTPMQWDNSANLGFSTADSNKLYLPVDDREDAPTVENQKNKSGSIYETVTKLIKIRHENPDLQADGDFEVLYAEKEKYPFVFRRGRFIIAVNPSAERVTAPLSYELKNVVYSIGEASAENNEIVMLPQSFGLFEMK